MQISASLVFFIRYKVPHRSGYCIMITITQTINPNLKQNTTGCRYLYCLMVCWLTENDCILHLSCNYILLVSGCIKSHRVISSHLREMRRPCHRCCTCLAKMSYLSLATVPTSFFFFYQITVVMVKPLGSTHKQLAHNTVEVNPKETMQS